MPRLLSLVMFLPLASAPLAGAPSTKPTVPEVRIDGLDGDAVLKRDVLAVCRDIARFCATTMPSGPPLGGASLLSFEGEPVIIRAVCGCSSRQQPLCCRLWACEEPEQARACTTRDSRAARSYTPV